jgi:hypothetical protein
MSSNLHRKIKIEKGICITCDQPTRHGLRNCQNCADKQAQKNKELYIQRKENKICSHCGTEPATHGNRCFNCREKERKYAIERARKRKEDGQCARCGKLNPNKLWYCDDCRVVVKKTTKKREDLLVSQGICMRCRKSPIYSETRHCQMCLLKSIARKTGGSSKKAKELGFLLVENRKCPYTGRTLILGKNASLDHKIPVALGGNNDIENFEWIDFDVNVLKSDRTKEEFLVLWKSLVKDSVKAMFNVDLDQIL